jgi:hypothetical protein
MPKPKEEKRETVATPEGTPNAGMLLPLGTVLKVCIPVIVAVILAVAGGVFALTKFSTEQHVNALRTQVETANNRAEKAETALHTAPISESTSGTIGRQSLPDVTRKSANDASTLDDLARKLSVVEQERDMLIQQLSQKALGSLDPNSELPVLLSHLKSNERQIRQEAVTGLLLLKDRRSFAHLASYFKANREEATQGMNGLLDWCDVFIALDPRNGMEIVVEELDNKDSNYSYLTYEALDRRINTIDLIEAAKPCLENFALRSMNASARTRAKVLLNGLPQRKSEIIKKAEWDKAEAERAKADTDKRSSREILLSIDRIVARLVGTDPNQAHIPSETKN